MGHGLARSTETGRAALGETGNTQLGASCRMGSRSCLELLLRREEDMDPWHQGGIGEGQGQSCRFKWVLDTE